MARTFHDPCSDAVILSGQSSEDCSKAQAHWILAATILASSMAFIDGTVVNVAIPFLQQNLHATAAGVQWVVESYSLFLAALLLVGGSLGDRYGRRRVFVIGVVLFAAASAACGLSMSIRQLIVARAVQGIGGALLVPGSLAIISASFGPDSRGAAIGTWSGFSAMTAAIGPVLGGWLVEHFSWRAVFFLNVPLAVAVVVICLTHVPESRSSTQRLDWLGATLATIGLGLLVFGLIESSGDSFSRTLIICSLVGGVISLSLFVLNEGRSESAMMPLHLFSSRDFAGANLLTLFLYTALSGMMFFLALNLIQVNGYSATAAGASLLPFVVIMFTLSRWSGGLVDRYGAKLPLVIGPMIAAVGFGLLSVPSLAGSYWTSYFPAVVVLGVGMAITVAPLTTTVMGSVDQEQAGVASGVNNAVSRTAGLLAIAIYGVIVLHSFSNALNQKLVQANIDEDLRGKIYGQRVRLAGLELPTNLPPETHDYLKESVQLAFVSGFRMVMFVSAGLALASALSAWLLISSKGRSAKKRAEQPNQ